MLTVLSAAERELLLLLLLLLLLIVFAISLVCFDCCALICSVSRARKIAVRTAHRTNVNTREEHREYSSVNLLSIASIRYRNVEASSSFVQQRTNQNHFLNITNRPNLFQPKPLRFKFSFVILLNGGSCVRNNL